MKAAVIGKINENKKLLPKLAEQVFVKNSQKEQKTSNKYKANSYHPR